MPNMELNSQQTSVLYHIILYQRTKHNFAQTFEEMAKICAEYAMPANPSAVIKGAIKESGVHITSQLWGASDLTVMPQTIKALERRDLIYGCRVDGAEYYFLTHSGVAYLHEKDSRLQDYMSFEESNKHLSIANVRDSQALKDKEAQDVQNRITRIDAMRETPPQVGEYLLFHRNSTEEPRLVYIEHVYPDTEKVHARELGSRMVDNAGWQYLERPLSLPHNLHYDLACNALEYDRPSSDTATFSPRRRIGLDGNSNRIYVATCDTLDQLKVFHLMLSEFIILQERKG